MLRPPSASQFLQLLPPPTPPSQSGPRPPELLNTHSSMSSLVKQEFSTQLEKAKEQLKDLGLPRFAGEYELTYNTDFKIQLMDAMGLSAFSELDMAALCHPTNAPGLTQSIPSLDQCFPNFIHPAWTERDINALFLIQREYLEAKKELTLLTGSYWNELRVACLNHHSVLPMNITPAQIDQGMENFMHRQNEHLQELAISLTRMYLLFHAESVRALAEEERRAVSEDKGKGTMPTPPTTNRRGSKQSSPSESKSGKTSRPSEKDGEWKAHVLALPVKKRYQLRQPSASQPIPRYQEDTNGYEFDDFLKALEAEEEDAKGNEPEIEEKEGPKKRQKTFVDHTHESGKRTARTVVRKVSANKKDAEAGQPVLEAAEVAKEPAPKKKRNVLPSDALWETYNADPFPSVAKREAIAKSSGLTMRQINTWFNNRRCRDKANGLLKIDVEEAQ